MLWVAVLVSVANLGQPAGREHNLHLPLNREWQPIRYRAECNWGISKGGCAKQWHSLYCKATPLGI